MAPVPAGHRGDEPAQPGGRGGGGGHGRQPDPQQRGGRPGIPARHLDRRDLGGRRDGQSSSTTTDSAGSVTLRRSPGAVPPVNGAGSTACAASNVLCDVMDGAVSIRPIGVLRSAPATAHETVTGASGFVLTRERWILPDASREAEALTSGILTGDCGRSRGASSPGSETASWWTRNISNTW